MTRDPRTAVRVAKKIASNVCITLSSWSKIFSISSLSSQILKPLKPGILSRWYFLILGVLECILPRFPELEAMFTSPRARPPAVPSSNLKDNKYELAHNPLSFEGKRNNHSIKALVCQWVCLFGCSLTLLKRQTPASWNFEGWFPWDGKGCRLKNIWILQTIAHWASFIQKQKNQLCIFMKKILCSVSIHPYT